MDPTTIRLLSIPTILFVGVSCTIAAWAVFHARKMARRTELPGILGGVLPGPILGGVLVILSRLDRSTNIPHGPSVSEVVGAIAWQAGFIAMIVGGCFGAWVGFRGRIPIGHTSGCVKCGYDLRGLPDRRCPECGHSF